jgi:hypothetical protein
MPMKKCVGALAALGWLAAAPAAWPHHGSAPHFFMDRSVEFTGTVRSFEARNPHSFVNVDVTEGGETLLWRCELNSIASIRRAGIDERTFLPGTRVRITGHPGRRDEHECYFRSAELADGRVVTQGQVPPTALPQDAAPAIEQAGIFGTWTRKVAAAGGVAAPTMMQFLTPAGRAASAAYDPYRDDPARQCSPVGPQRLWANPVQPFEIVRDGERIVIRYEFMDAVREVHLNRSAPPADAPRTVLGASVGRFEGATLVIDSSLFAPGVVTQYAQTAPGEFAGILHSDEYRLTERVSVNAASGELEVSWVHEDPQYFTEAQSSAVATFVRRPDLRVQPYNCVPDPL